MKFYFYNDTLFDLDAVIIELKYEILFMLLCRFFCFIMKNRNTIIYASTPLFCDGGVDACKVMGGRLF
jgi:hypothetical protein